ncbi:MAG TPA: type II toxin-antitoxin system HicA family toxin [Bryobacteraceae bacterium]|nr:type II toxin-antitoxin system HicA family toxin [Bryobacteraceae bacterium]
MATIRQKRSHVRLRHPGPPAHVITVPLHAPLKSGTLHSILSEVAQERSVTMDSIVEEL